MTKLKIFLGILFWVLFNFSTAKAQEDIASQVVGYCEENVINGETIQWSLEAIINCLFFKPEINNEYKYETYIILSEEEKYLEKIKVMISHIELISIKSITSSDHSEVRWVINFNDKSSLVGETSENELPEGISESDNLELLPELVNHIYLKEDNLSVEMNLSEFSEKYSNGILFDLYFLYRNELRHQEFNIVYVL
mgnify:CR=1 FL=1|tara:strand:- start:11058 stop:11645 length:588 start_codon:yes stop_codon:yes gene_type:complete